MGDAKKAFLKALIRMIDYYFASILPPLRATFASTSTVPRKGVT